MHPEAFAYVASVTDGRTFGKVLEFGSRDINGTVRGLFGSADYTGTDIEPGPGVDVVCDATEWKRKGFDAVVCCEVLEHTPKAPQIIAAARRALKAKGLLILTCATTGRAPHSAFDGAGVRPGEFYRNVTRKTLETWLGKANGFTSWDVTVNGADLYCTAVA